jgi:hypothetical protein
MQLVSISCKGGNMDKAKAKVLVSILKDSSLYQTMSHEEKNSLLSRLEKDYPAIFDAKAHKEEEETERQESN